MGAKDSRLARHHPAVSRALIKTNTPTVAGGMECIPDATARKEFVHWLKSQNAVLLAHYYTPDVIQNLAHETGGLVADSLEMARFGQDHPAKTLVVAGVRFMAETAKILSPHKKVLMVASEATCSLDLGCPADDFADFCACHPERTVVVYANTSAAVKAQADWVVTSRIAVDVVEHLAERGEKILWAPDKHLGSYIQQQTGADMVLWDGACVVHEEFRAEGIRHLQAVHPEAAVIAHPESPPPVLALADAIGSTSEMVEAARTLPHAVMIVATDRGLFHSMRRAAPDKEFLQAPTQGKGATCRSCGHCPWMAMNTWERVRGAMADELHEVQVHTELRQRALKPLERMVNFKRQAEQLQAQQG